MTIIAERGKVWYFSSKHIYCAVFRIDDKDKQTNHDEQSVIPQNINLAADPSCEVFLTGRQLPTKVKERHLQGTGTVLFFFGTKVWPCMYFSQAGNYADQSSVQTFFIGIKSGHCHPLTLTDWLPEVVKSCKSWKIHVMTIGKDYKKKQTLFRNYS